MRNIFEIKIKFGILDFFYWDFTFSCNIFNGFVFFRDNFDFFSDGFGCDGMIISNYDNL